MKGAVLQASYEFSMGDLVEGTALNAADAIQVLSMTPNPEQQKVFKRSGVLFSASGIQD